MQILAIKSVSLSLGAEQSPFLPLAAHLSTIIVDHVSAVTPLGSSTRQGVGDGL